MDPHESSSNRVAERQIAEMGYVQKASVWRVLDMPARQRPREELERLGAANVPDAALVAILLRSGVRGVNVVDLADSLLTHYGSLAGLASATVEELMHIKGLGRVKAQVLVAALEIARRVQEAALPVNLRVRTPEDVWRLLEPRLPALDTEVFWVLHLDTKNRLKGPPVEVTRGLLDASLVHPREVFRRAIRAAVSAVVLAHNHPSGDPSPSAEDVRITRQLVEAGRVVDIKVLDHVVVGRCPQDGQRPFVSLREEGMVNFDLT